MIKVGDRILVFSGVVANLSKLKSLGNTSLYQMGLEYQESIVAVDNDSSTKP